MLTHFCHCHNQLHQLIITAPSALKGAIFGHTNSLLSAGGCISQQGWHHFTHKQRNTGHSWVRLILCKAAPPPQALFRLRLSSYSPPTTATLAILKAPAHFKSAPVRAQLVRLSRQNSKRSLMFQWRKDVVVISNHLERMLYSFPQSTRFMSLQITCNECKAPGVVVTVVMRFVFVFFVF